MIFTYSSCEHTCVRDITYHIQQVNVTTKLDGLLKFHHFNGTFHENLRVDFNQNSREMNLSMGALPMLPDEKENSRLYIISMIHASLESVFKTDSKENVVAQQGHNYAKLASQSIGKIFGDYSPWQIFQTFEANEAVKIKNLSALIELSWNCHETKIFDRHKCNLYVGRLCRELRCSTYS